MGISPRFKELMQSRAEWEPTACDLPLLHLPLKPGLKGSQL